MAAISAAVVLAAMANGNQFGQMADDRIAWMSSAFDQEIPVSFELGGKRFDSRFNGWITTRQAKNDGFTVTATDPSSGVQLTVTVRSYSDFPVVEWKASLKNTGKEDSPLIQRFMPLSGRFATAGTPLLHHFLGSVCDKNDYEPYESSLRKGERKAIASTSGRATQDAMPYFNIETGKAKGVIAAIGWPGQWTSSFENLGNGVQITGGQADTSFILHSGEEIKGPMSVLLFYRGDWIDGQNVWRRWMMKHNQPKLKPQISICTGNSYPGIITNAAEELHFLKRYKEIGVNADYWWQDAGWYKCGDPPNWGVTGTWEIDKSRWPNGIRGVSDWVHENGMKTIVWFEPERVHPGTWLADNKPEWVLGGKNGGLLNLGLKDCQEWITDRIDSLIKSERIDFYRQDYNIAPLEHWKMGDAPDRQGITEAKYVDGYFGLWDELKRRNRNMPIDSCASGGRRNDVATLRRAVPLLRSDYIFEPIGEQCHTYGISFWIPFNGTGFLTEDIYLIRSQQSPEFTVGVDVRPTDQKYEVLKKAIKEWREINDYYAGDYYPLSQYSIQNDIWMAWQFNLPEKGKGFFQAFRRGDCEQPSCIVKLRGLKADAKYTVEEIDTRKRTIYTGTQLMAGYTVESATRPAALVFKYWKSKP